MNLIFPVRLVPSSCIPLSSCSLKFEVTQHTTLLPHYLDVTRLFFFIMITITIKNTRPVEELVYPSSKQLHIMDWNGKHSFSQGSRLVWGIWSDLALHSHVYTYSPAQPGNVLLFSSMPFHTVLQTQHTKHLLK